MPTKTKGLSAGDKAPEFTVLNQDEKKVSLKDFKGKWVVLYFYPRDLTPGCTIEANEFTSEAKNFQKLGAVIVGVSADTCKSHQKFIEKYDLKITLLSDTDRKILEPYGVWQLKKFMGRESMGIVRTTFLIDPKGMIAHIWPKVSVKGHVAEVKETLKALR